MKPDSIAARAPSGWPSSIVSWVSKWLRERSSLPANGTNAASPRSHSA